MGSSNESKQLKALGHNNGQDFNDSNKHGIKYRTEHPGNEELK
jgi:hypothetical protein